MATRYYFTNERKITLKRGIAEWFNEDCPVIEDENGYRVFSNFINGVFAEEELRPQLYKFIKSSYRMACIKYKWEENQLEWLEELNTKKV